jgi:hypothetical protein
VRSVAVLAILVIGCSGAPSRAPVTVDSGSDPPPPASDVRVVITGKTITMNGKPITGTPMVRDFISVFGKPTRTWDSGGPNRIHTWDAIGLLVYEPKDGRAVAATFPYRAMASTFTPKNLFAGSIVLDGKAFTPKLSLQAIKSWRGATRPYSESSVVFDRGDFHVFTIEEARGTAIDLVELSFWQKGKLATRPPGRKPQPNIIPDEHEEECRNGDASRCTSLALAYQTGARGQKNAERAFALAKQGCAGGDPFACLMLGNMLDAGHGVAKSATEAKAAWKRACTLGYKAACDLAK